MACARVLVVAALLAVTTSQSTPDDEMMRSSLMRRQKHTQDIHLHVGSHGEMIQKDGSAPAAKAKGSSGQPGEVSWCDTAYPLSANTGVVANSCDKGGKVRREEDCIHAAAVLNKSMGNFDNTSSPIINDDWENPDPYVKDCFLYQDKVFFNPTDSVQNASFAGWRGTPICHEQIYKAGNESTVENQVDSDEACYGDYEMIATYDECMWAHDCEWGGMFCQAPEFGNDAYTTDKAPRGCYRNELGCYGFNAATTPPSNITAKMRGVCRLKTYQFTGDHSQESPAANSGEEMTPLHGAGGTTADTAAADTTAAATTAADTTAGTS